LAAGANAATAAMSTDAVVLRCLSVACGEDLQLFERVVVVSGSERRVCFVCIGKHGLLFVGRDMESLLEKGGKLLYLCIARVVVDTSSPTLFLLEVAAADDAAEAAGWEHGDRLLVESQHRELLLERLAICWQTEQMFRRYRVQKLPLARAAIGAVIVDSRGVGNRAQTAEVMPFRGYESGFSHAGYAVFLREGFKSVAGLKTGSFVHASGWEVTYYAKRFAIPAGVEVTLHVGDPVPLLILEGCATGDADLRTRSTSCREALVEDIGQFYSLASGAYLKRMNRTDDIAAWSGWEFAVRSRENLFVCVLLRREYIPPLCDIAQDITVLLRCPGEGICPEVCDVLIDECRFVADTVAPIARETEVYRDIVQARLDSLQYTEEAYRWLEGRFGMAPVHKRPAALKFLKSIVHALHRLGQVPDSELLDAEIFRGLPVLHDPLLVAQEMLSDAEPLLGTVTREREERRSAWLRRISTYLLHCVDGGVLGERLTVSTIVQAVIRAEVHGEAGEELRGVLDFLLHATPRENSGTWLTSRITVAEFLRRPEHLGRFAFNQGALQVLLGEHYLADEWRRYHRNSGVLYEALLAAFLDSSDIGLATKTLICRNILEMTVSKEYAQQEGESKICVLVPALVRAMRGASTSLASCATAALVNLSCDRDAVKTLLVSDDALALCMAQLQRKDDDLTHYTLLLLVNLTKKAHHRAIVIREGIVPLVVDILTSSYHHAGKHKILTEVASVIGQLCNDPDTRTMLAEDFPVVPCLLYINDQTGPNTKLKAKLLFALRQLCVGQHKLKIGQHVIPNVLHQLSRAKPKHRECAMNAVLLLTMLAAIRTNAQDIFSDNRLEHALERCGAQRGGEENPEHGFGSEFWERVLTLKERIREQVVIDTG